MKTTKKPDTISAEIFSKLDRFFPKNEDKWAISSTTLTLIEALGNEIMEAFEPHQLSSKAKYAIIQYGKFRRLLYQIIKDEVSLSEHKKNKIEYMSLGNWEDDEDWEEKYIFIVKTSYKELKDEGKI